MGKHKGVDSLLLFPYIWKTILLEFWQICCNAWEEMSDRYIKKQTKKKETILNENKCINMSEYGHVTKCLE